MDYNFCDTLVRFCPLDLVQCLMKRNLLKETQICLESKNLLHLRTDASTSDGMKCKCRHSKCPKKKTNLSIHMGSWLSTFNYTYCTYYYTGIRD